MQKEDRAFYKRLWSAKDKDEAESIVFGATAREIEKELDRLLPPWRPPVALEVDSKAEAFLTDADEEAENGVREVEHNGDIHVMPFQNYARGIDGAGNMCPVVIATQRKYAYDSQVKQAHNSGYMEKVLNDFPKLGWLFVDHPRFDTKPDWQDKVRSTDEDDRLDTWRRLCLVEMFRRRQAKKVREDKEAENFLTKQEQLVRNFRAADAEATRDMVRELVSGFGEKLAKVVEQGKGKAKQAE